MIMATAYNKRVSGSGFQPSPKSPTATSHTRQTLGDSPNGEKDENE